jgi:hypothetical protein
MYNEELNDLYSSPNTLLFEWKKQEMSGGWGMCHVQKRGEMRTGFFVGKQKKETTGKTWT